VLFILTTLLLPGGWSACGRPNGSAAAASERARHDLAKDVLYPRS
jgi:hypothetical protein